MWISILSTRIALIALATLLALPLAQFASPVEARKRSRIVTITRAFRNPAAIELPLAQTSPVSASLYPSPIGVSGLKGTIRDVNLRLINYSHAWVDDVEVLLVGPGGQTAIVMANVGGNPSADDWTLRLDDEAEKDLTLATRSGTFRPTNRSGEAVAFNAPAPSANANAALSVFDGTDPNGTWRLFAQDQVALGDSGAIAGGWELEIATRVKAKKKKR